MTQGTQTHGIKIAIVTGGSRGLGRNAALQLARKGLDVIVTYQHQQAEAEAVVAEVARLGRTGAALRLDVGDPNSFGGFADTLASTLQAQWNRASFDVLVNNAGISRPSPIAQTEEAAIDELYRVHFKGVYLLTQRLLPLLSDGGRVINLSTGLARFTTPGYAAYASMKGAIEVFTRYLAKELGPRRITCNVVAPGPIDTDFTKSAFENHPQMREIISAQAALGRVGVPDDIGGIVAFLCTDDARWITAQRIEASGGLFL